MTMIIWKQSIRILFLCLLTGWIPMFWGGSTILGQDHLKMVVTGNVRGQLDPCG